MKTWITTGALLLLCGVAILWFASDYSKDHKARPNVELQDSTGTSPPDEANKRIADSKANDSYAQWLQDYRSRVQKLSSEYEREILSLGLYYMLLPDNLADKHKAEQSRTRIDSFMNTVSTYEESTLEELQHSESGLSSLTDAGGKASYHAYVEAKDDIIRDIREYYEIQRNILNTTGQILDIAINRPDTLEIQNGELTIQDQETSELYNKLAKRLTELGEQEEQGMKKLKDKHSAEASK